MNQRKQDRQLARIPRIIRAIADLETRRPEDKRIPGLKNELERRQLEVRAFALTPSGEGFDKKVAEAVRADK
jgi:hypothetical protein